MVQHSAVSGDKDILARFGRRVRELRKAKGFSQEALAEKCSLDRTYVSSVERGRRNLSLRSIRTIAEALGVSMSQLVRGVD